MLSRDGYTVDYGPAVADEMTLKTPHAAGYRGACGLPHPAITGLAVDSEPLFLLLFSSRPNNQDHFQTR